MSWKQFSFYYFIKKRNETQKILFISSIDSLNEKSKVKILKWNFWLILALNLTLMIIWYNKSIEEILSVWMAKNKELKFKKSFLKKDL